jgi:hypothetical protein
MVRWKFPKIRRKKTLNTAKHCAIAPSLAAFLSGKERRRKKPLNTAKHCAIAPSLAAFLSGKERSLFPRVIFSHSAVGEKKEKERKELLGGLNLHAAFNWLERRLRVAKLF